MGQKASLPGHYFGNQLSARMVGLARCKACSAGTGSRNAQVSIILNLRILPRKLHSTCYLSTWWNQCLHGICRWMNECCSTMYGSQINPHVLQLYYCHEQSTTTMTFFGIHTSVVEHLSLTGIRRNGSGTHRLALQRAQESRRLYSTGRRIYQLVLTLIHTKD